jgi:MFS family permease
MPRGFDKRAWIVVAMLFAFMLINFADKAILGLAAGPIMQELKLTHTQFGQVGSSFFLFFSLSAIVVGFVVNRVQTKWALAVMAAAWALIQLPMLMVVGLPFLMANRIILGAGEGPAYPVALHASYKWFPNEKRPLPTSVIALGGAFGTGVVAPGITYVILNYSWHAAFGLLGVLGLVWVMVWLVVGREGPLSANAGHAADTGAIHLPYARLLTCRTVVGTMVVGFCAYWLLTLAVVWLPNYLVKGAGYSPTATGWIVTLPAFSQIIFSPAICTLSERLKLREVSSRVSRAVLASSCVLVAGILTFALPQVAPGAVQIAIITLAFSVGAVIFALGHVMVAEVTPVGQRGAMLGILNAVMSLAGIFAPLAMGMVVDVGINDADGFRTGFMIAGALVVVGSMLGLLLINPEADLRRFSRRADDTLALKPLATRA